MRLPYIELPMVAVIDIMHLFRNLIDDLYNVLRKPFNVDDSDQHQLIISYRSLRNFPSVLQFMTHDFYDVTDKLTSKEIILPFLLVFPLLVRHIKISKNACDLVETLAALMYLLLADEITSEMLSYAEHLTEHFFRLWLRFAGPRRCSPTKHAILHLIEMVKYHGPLVHVAAFKDESNIVCINRRVHHGMRVPAVLHNNIYHAAAAKHFFHDMLVKMPIAAKYRDHIKELGPRSYMKNIDKRVGAVGLIGQLAAEKVTRHSFCDLREALPHFPTSNPPQPWALFTSFVTSDRCEFITAQNYVTRPSKFKDCFAVDSSGTFWDIQYAFWTEDDQYEYAGILGYKIKPTAEWTPYPTMLQQNFARNFFVRGKRENRLSATDAVNIRYYALNVTPIAAARANELCLITVPFCVTLS